MFDVEIVQLFVFHKIVSPSKKTVGNSLKKHLGLVIAGTVYTDKVNILLWKL